MSEFEKNLNNSLNGENQRPDDQQRNLFQGQPYQNQQNQNQQIQSQQIQNQQLQNQQLQNQQIQYQTYQNQFYQNQNAPYQGQQLQNQNRQFQNAKNNDQLQGGKIPQYSFWAEQIPTSNSSNQNYNSWGYNNTMNNRTMNNGSFNYNSVNNQEMANPLGSGKKKKEKKALKLVFKAACFGLIAGISFIGMQLLYHRINPGSTGGSSINTASGLNFGINSDNKYQIATTKPTSVKTTSKSEVSDVVKKTMPAIVSIHSTLTESNVFFGEQDVEGSGSGIVIGKDEKEFLIATNNHVVAGTNKIRVTFTDGKEAEAVIKGTDATADLAVISVDTTKLSDSTKKAIEIAKLGDSTKVKVGEMAIAIGNALGYGQSVTVGYISAKDRTVDVSDGYDSKKMVLLQTDAAINPGNSGGALLNLDGEVIGINSIKYADNEVEGMGYAIPISKATPIINELKSREILSKEDQGYLGITGNDVTEDVAKSYNMPVGVYVYEVSKDGAAEKAGLLHGDIITAVNGVEITSMTQLKEKVNSMKVGTEVVVKYKRSTDGKYKKNEVTVTLGKNPRLNSTDKKNTNK